MKTTKLQLEETARRLDLENTVLLCAFNDILNGDVKWFGNSRTYSIGITRPTSACGGIAVIRHERSARAVYFEQFARTELEHISLIITGANTEYNLELMRRRSVIESAQAYVSE